MSKKSNTKRALLIANPGSGNVSGRGKLLEQVARRLVKLGIKLDVAVAKPKEQTTPIARKAIKDGYKLIIAMGGDDTIQAVIRGMGKSKVHLGMIPAGTANNLARSLGIPEDPKEACELIASGKFRKLDLVQAKVGKGKKFLFFDLLTVGIAATLYPSALHVRKGKAILQSIKDEIYKVIMQPANPKITLEMDDQSNITVETMMALVTNFPLIGQNMLVDPLASTDDGLVNISLYPNISKAELLAYMVETTNQGVGDDSKIQRYRAHKLKIKAEPKLEIMADGVMLGKGTVKIKVLPGALRVISPEVGTGVEKAPLAASAELPVPVGLTTDNNKARTNGNGKNDEPQSEKVAENIQKK